MMNLFSKGFARHIDSADGRKSLFSPPGQSAIQDRDILITEFSKQMGGKRCPAFAFVVNDDGNPPVRYQRGDTKFYLASRQRSGIGNLTKVKLTPLANIEYGMRSLGSHQNCQVVARNFNRHSLDPPSNCFFILQGFAMAKEH